MPGGVGRSPQVFLALLLASGCNDHNSLSGLSAALELRPTLLDFGTLYVGQEAVATVVLKNTGLGQLELPRAALLGAGFELLDTPPASLGAFDAESLRVIFRATAPGP